jgi:hypothetical protein
VLIALLWGGVFFFGFLGSGGVSVFLWFVLLFIGTIAIPFIMRFGWQALVNTRLGEAHISANTNRIQRGIELTCRFEQPVKSQVAIQGGSLRLMRYEWVKYTQGTDTYTDTYYELIDEMVYDDYGYKAGDVIEMQAQFVIPSDAVHNFSYANNRVQWLIVASVKIVAWPDYYEEFELDFPAR